jgi:polysaccharide biosynthesis/export protein
MLTLGCSLPRSGPTHKELISLKGDEIDAFEYLEGVDFVASSENVAISAAFSNEWFTKRFNPDAIQPGDTLSIQVIENVNEGVFASGGNRIFLQEGMVVPENGDIFLPYVGALGVVGHSTEEVRLQIQQALEGQTPNPQISVFRTPGVGAGVTLLGEVGTQGIRALELGRLTLLEMIAAAGGSRIEADATLVLVQRTKLRTQLMLEDILSSPANNINLQPGDKIVLSGSNRYVSVLGSTGSQTRVQIKSNQFTLIELLAEVGGIKPDTANPKGIFVFRRSMRDGSRDLVVHFDLSDALGIASVRRFYLNSGDTVFVSEAPIENFRKTLGTVLDISTSAASVTGN